MISPAYSSHDRYIRSAQYREYGEQIPGGCPRESIALLLDYHGELGDGCRDQDSEKKNTEIKDMLQAPPDDRFARFCGCFLDVHVHYIFPVGFVQRSQRVPCTVVNVRVIVSDFTPGFRSGVHGVDLVT